MPELPEVETIRRGLANNLAGKVIANFNSDWPKNINKPLTEYKRLIKGLKILTVKRRAKMLILNLSDHWNILIHLKMTGQLVYGSKTKCLVGGHTIEAGYDCLPNKFTHAIFTFTDNAHLFFNDIRKFGWLKLLMDLELKEELEKMELGPEPLSKQFTFAYFQQSLARRPKNKIKQFLMDNKILVGVGNIYSDEVCFYAKVRPNRLVRSLTKVEIKMLYTGIKNILQAAIKAQGTTFSNYRTAQGETGTYAQQLKVYGRYDEQCLVCYKTINKLKIGGRTSSFCPKCQK